MKGIKIEVEHEKPIFLYRPIDVIDAIAYAIYFSANPATEMFVPNNAYEKADRIFRKWKDEVREKKTKKKMTDEEMSEEYFKSVCKAFLAGLKAGTPKWHKIADGDLPEDCSCVLCRLSDDGIETAYYENREFTFCAPAYHIDDVIAWCNIPE